MKYKKGTIGLLIIILLLGVTRMNVLGFLGFSNTEKWKEEVQLSDGRIIVVEREIINERGGGEWASNRSGLKPKEYYMRFVHPDESGKTIEWRSTKKSGTWPEIPLILDLESGQPVIFTIVGISAHRCEMYCKYLYRNGTWSEEPLPERFEPRMRNLFVRGKVDIPNLVDLETKLKINESKHSRKPVRQVGPNREICG
jgi:hypothetical protein